MSRKLRKRSAPLDLNKPIFDLEEAAAFLQLHVSTVKRKARAGLIPAQKVGQQWRFSRKRLEEMFADKGDQPEVTP